MSETTVADPAYCAAASASRPLRAADESTLVTTTNPTPTTMARTVATYLRP
jgi:hypothetical protein